MDATATDPLQLVLVIDEPFSSYGSIYSQDEGEFHPSMGDEVLQGIDISPIHNSHRLD